MEQKKQSGLGTAALILGIIGILTACIILGIIPCVVGLILALIAFTERNRKKGTAIAGLVCSLIGILLFAFIMICEPDGDNAQTEDVSHATEHALEQRESLTVESSEQEPAQVPEETEQEYKDSCKEYKYKDVLRNPQDYVGERIKITAKIYSVHEESWSNDGKYYFVYSNDEYNIWHGDRYAIYDRREVQDPKLLSEDVITIWGEISNPEQTTSLIVSSEEIFVIDMKYAELLSE